ncbi:taurine dioxygenase [Roseomonas rosea]|uniref:Taurine dioxygenase n=1 Tax=Muricoccus roseus TaxID=198092 RepID=A0A1M6RHZ7_9PROT|nr:TauD/TfdA family dioxygenase [Roseomonas rosea]SHK32059.1 taurine dioxygenase [Roseomonas rosea]
MMTAIDLIEDLSVRPLTPTFGAEIRGIDLSRPVQEREAQQLQALFREYQLLLFRNQALTPEEQGRFGEVFGRIELREHNKVKPASIYEQTVSNVREDGVFGRGEMSFHMDQIFYQEPLNALILYGIQIPPEGGDTCFCDTSAVHDEMPTALKEKLGRITCHYRRDYDSETAERYNVSMAEETRVSAVHPLVMKDEETGRTCLWVTGSQMKGGILGVPEEEGRALIAEVRRRIETTDAVYRHRWQPGDLVLWNNRTLQHARTHFDPSHARTLRRTGLLW